MDREGGEREDRQINRRRGRKITQIREKDKESQRDRLTRKSGGIDSGGWGGGGV